jgi:uncharacterized MnhB-related membrane protein
MKEVFLLLLIPVALYAIQTRKLRNAIVALCAFSLFASVCYLLYNAPDVAIAEAVIGTTLSTILYLVALQKYKVFTVYFMLEGEALSDAAYFQRAKDQMTKALEKFCAKQELELLIFYSADTLEHISKKHAFSIIINESESLHEIYGHSENLKLAALTDFLTDEAIPHRIQILKEVTYET